MSQAMSDHLVFSPESLATFRAGAALHRAEVRPVRMYVCIRAVIYQL